MLRTRLNNVTRFEEAETPDIVYLNLDIVDGKEVDEGVGTEPIASYNDTRDTAIIKDSSKYYFSIVRFQLNGSGISIPLFIPNVKPDPSGTPNTTIYTVGLSVTADVSGTGTATYTSTKPIIWETQSTTAEVPPTLESDGSQVIEGDYYYLYTYEHFTGLMNKAFQSAWDDLNAQFSAGVGGGADLITKPPKIFYNSDTNRFELYGNTYGWGGDSRSSSGLAQDESFKMYFNSNLFGLFDSFPNEYEGGDLAAKNESGIDEFAYEILFKNKLGKNLHQDITEQDASGNDIEYLVVDQEWVSTGTLWSPVGSIVFVSTLIPVLNENTSQPLTYGAGNSATSISTRSAFQPIVTDIALALDRADQYKEMITYIPSAEYRISTMSNSPTEVRNVDIQVYWRNRLDGNLVPVKLFNKSSVSMKIMFRKRDYL